MGGYELLDLASPADDGGLQSLDEVTVLGVGMGVVQVLLRDVEVSLTTSLVGVLVQESHELVDTSDELLFDGVRPVIFGQKNLDVVGCHLLEKIVERLLVDGQEGDVLLQTI